MGATSGYFGGASYPFAMAADGEMLIVGADRQNTYGRFFVFNRRTNADTWDQSFQSGTTNYLNYYLGRAIVICGTDIYVSAPSASYRGYVRHYTRSSTSAS